MLGKSEKGAGASGRNKNDQSSRRRDYGYDRRERREDDYGYDRRRRREDDYGYDRRRRREDDCGADRRERWDYGYGDRERYDGRTRYDEDDYAARTSRPGAQRSERTEGSRRRSAEGRQMRDYGYGSGRGGGGRGRKRKHTVRNVLITVLVILLALGGGLFAFLGQIDREKLTGLITNSGVSQTGYRNIALYGVDSREGQLTRDTHSDTIMICSINKKTKQIRLASVYRDTYLDNTNGEYRKATECYFYGGPERSINMLNKNLDLDITDYVTVDFAAVIQIVDALGGIDLNITDEEMELINGYCVENKEVTGVDYTPLTTSGDVHLTGIQALAYCRIRYTEGWDYKRTERQRTVLTLCYQKAQQKGIGGMTALASAVMPNISTSMDNLEILSLASGIGGYTLGEQTGFPFDKSTANLSDAGDVVVPVNLAQNVIQLHQFLFDDASYSPSETVRQISDTIAANTGIY